MATRTIANGGGNWNSTATWVEGAIPVAGDAVVATATSGQLTVTATAACASMDFTGYANTLTLSGAVSLTITGNVTLATGMTITGTGTTLLLTGTHTLTANGKTWSSKMSTAGIVGAITLADDWTVGALFSSGSSPVINGVGKKLKLAGGWTTATGTVSGTAEIQITGTGTITGSTGICTNNLTFVAGAGTVTFTTTPFNYATGTLTYTSGTISWGTVILTITGSCSIDWGNLSNQIASFTVTGASAVITLVNNPMYVSTLNCPNVAHSYAGTQGWIANTFGPTANLSAARTITLAAGTEYKISAAFTLGTRATASNTLSIVGSDGTHATLAKLTLQNGATQDVSYTNPTDIDSSLGQTIYDYKGSQSNSLNWATTFPPVQRRPQAQLVG